MDNKRYYWLKLKENFFDEDTIAWLEEQPNGEKYSLFYLKLCLKSLKNDGLLIRSVGDILIPYDNKKLSEMTRTDIDTVIIAMELFKKIGLIQILDNGEIYITQLEKMIGSEAGNNNAQRQKRFRERQKNKQKMLCVTNSNANSNVEIDIEKEIDIDIELESEEDEKNDSSTDDLFNFFSNNIHSLTGIETEKLIEWEKVFPDEVIKEAINRAVLNNARTMNYIEGILRNWKNKGYKTLRDIQEEQEEFDKKKSKNNDENNEYSQEFLEWLRGSDEDEQG